MGRVVRYGRDYLEVNDQQPDSILKDIAEHREDQNEFSAKLMRVQSENVRHDDGGYARGHCLIEKQIGRLLLSPLLSQRRYRVILALTRRRGCNGRRCCG